MALAPCPSDSARASTLIKFGRQSGPASLARDSASSSPSIWAGSSRSALVLAGSVYRQISSCAGLPRAPSSSRPRSRRSGSGRPHRSRRHPRRARGARSGVSSIGFAVVGGAPSLWATRARPTRRVSPCWLLPRGIFSAECAPVERRARERERSFPPTVVLFSPAFRWQAGRRAHTRAESSFGRSRRCCFSKPLLHVRAKAAAGRASEVRELALPSDRSLSRCPDWPIARSRAAPDLYDPRCGLLAPRIGDRVLRAAASVDALRKGVTRGLRPRK